MDNAEDVVIQQEVGGGEQVAVGDEVANNAVAVSSGTETTVGEFPAGIASDAPPHQPTEETGVTQMEQDVKDLNSSQEDPNSAQKDQPVPDVIEEKKEPTEEEKLWATLQTNPGDFQAWVNLIHLIEKLEDIQKLRIVYDNFLAEFPLCYGYWKKYADHETTHGEAEKVDEVYERAVMAVAYSVDMWMYYSAHKAKTLTDPEEVRSAFERGLAYVGTDYLAHILWDKYLEFEVGKEEWIHVAQLYTRILQIPMQQLDRYWRDFKTFVASHSLLEYQTPEEIVAAAAPEPAPPAAGNEEIPGGGGEVTPEAPAAEEVKAEKTEAQKVEEYVAVREALYAVSRERDAKIRDFENLIKRPYFHVKPLDDIQLSVWHRYLDFVEKEGDLPSIVKLYERCVIPAASYPEYWIRYITKLTALESLDRATEALARAETIFVKRRPEIHLFAAKFKEQNGEISEARQEYTLLQELSPGLAEAVVRSANFENRQGNPDSATSIYEAAILAESTKESSSSLAFLYLQFGRYLHLSLGKVEKAREIYLQSVEKLPSEKKLWQAALSFEVSVPGVDRVKRVTDLVEKAISAVTSEGTPALSAADREEVSATALEFVDLLGSPNAVKAAEFLHKSLFPPKRSGFSDSKKRPLASDASLDRNPKQQRSYGAPAPYSNGQWGAPVRPIAGGGPPAGGVQGWGGYGAQAPAAAPPAYGGYGAAGYGYTAPAPQQPAYGGYAQPYAAPAATPAQGYAPQAAYGTAPTATAAQTSYYGAQQAYYG